MCTPCLGGRNWIHGWPLPWRKGATGSIRHMETTIFDPASEFLIFLYLVYLLYCCFTKLDKSALVNWPSPDCSFYLPVSMCRIDPVCKRGIWRCLMKGCKQHCLCQISMCCPHNRFHVCVRGLVRIPFMKRAIFHLSFFTKPSLYR
jgi:hypothetical protein